MALPETIPVRYTEEEAEYLSVRPVVRQVFRLHELLDMLLAVTGKDAERIRRVLRAGTVVFHYYRYWWDGFDPEPEELAAALKRFPDADPARLFREEQCTAVLLETGGHPARHSIEVAHADAARKPLFRSRSLWDCFLLLARDHVPAYGGYSYARRADLYELTLEPSQVGFLVAEAERLAGRSLRAQLRRLAEATRITFVCPR